MESNPPPPPPEEGKEEPDQGAGPDPVPLTIEECKLKLELTRKAALLSLLQFDAVWNPDGHNDSHLYEDQRNELVESNQHKVNKAKHQFLMSSAPYECKTQSKITAVTSPQNQTIRLKHTSEDNWKSGKTGKIPCLIGFTAEVRLITPADDDDNWSYTHISLVADQIPVDQC